MSKPRARGFTLIELLTVIAIIAILVGITAAVLPRVLEKSKVTKTETSFKQIQTALAAYQVDNASLPPAYGYRWNSDIDSSTVDPSTGNQLPTYWIWNLEPYMAKIKLFRVFGLYDEYWAATYDVAPSPSGNKHIDIMEFQPVGQETTPSHFVFLKDTLYSGNEGVTPEIANEVARMKAEVRPFFYIPVNKAQALKYQQFCDAGKNTNPSQYNGLVWDNSNSLLQGLQFPPANLDSYVLISPGPASSLGGIIPTDTNEVTTILNQLPIERRDDLYYILALRTYYLATRDSDGNNKLDYDFRTRSRGGQSDILLPDGTNGYGPLIFVGE